MIKINGTNTMYKTLVEFYENYIDYSRIYNKPVKEVVDIIHDESGIPTASIWTPSWEIDKINSDLVLIDAYTEGANIIPLFNKYPKNKRYVLMTNGTIDYSQYNIEQDYHHCVWYYFLQQITFLSCMPRNVEYWQKKQYEYSVDKQNLFCALVGWERPARDIFVQQVLNACKGMSFIFNYSGKELANESRKYDVNWDFDNYHSYESVLSYTHYSISFTLPIELYNTCRFYLVVETNIDLPGEFHLTEKTIKPIIAGIPFVLFAGAGYLENLQKIGFKTFDSLWDESYDKIESFNDRIQAVIKLIHFLNNEFDWAANLSKLQEITNHNRIHFMYNTAIYEKQIVDFAEVIKQACS